MKWNIKKNVCRILVLSQIVLLPGAVLAAEENEPGEGSPEIMFQQEQQPAEIEMNAQEEDTQKLVTIVGTINDNYQLVTKEGEVYEVAETETGDEMVRYTNDEVIAKGSVAIVDSQKVLSVVSFEFTQK